MFKKLALAAAAVPLRRPHRPGLSLPHGDHDGPLCRGRADRHGRARPRPGDDEAAGADVIVENRPSAGGIVGAQVIKNAKPDGYQILIHHIGMATIPSLYRNPASIRSRTSSTSGS
jgi:hypothetical protein